MASQEDMVALNSLDLRFASPLALQKSLLRPLCPCVLFRAQVICKDWSNLAGKNYIILNMTENIDCVSAELAYVEGPDGQREVPQWGPCQREASLVQQEVFL